jgi:hypothetical protein
MPSSGIRLVHMDANGRALAVITIHRGRDANLCKVAVLREQPAACPQFPCRRFPVPSLGRGVSKAADRPSRKLPRERRRDI